MSDGEWGQWHLDKRSGDNGVNWSQWTHHQSVDVTYVACVGGLQVRVKGCLGRAQSDKLGGVIFD